MHSYSYHLITEDNTIFIVIDDSGTAKTTTNTVDQLMIDEIKEDYLENNNKPLTDYLVIYEDTDGRWDGYNDKKDDFVYLGCKSEKDAINKYLKLIKS